MSVPFLSRTSGQCAWIVGDAAPPPAFKRQKIAPGPRVCGEAVVAGSSYCACHKAAATRPDQKSVKLYDGERTPRRAEADNERTQDLTELFT